MEQGHSELFCTATAVQLTPGSHLTLLELLTGFIGMLDSCGHALSQGHASDFHPRCSWEATPPGFQCLHESLEKTGSMPWGHACPDLLWKPSKAGRIRNAGRWG